jgi:hypothetical protein
MFIVPDPEYDVISMSISCILSIFIMACTIFGNADPYTFPAYLLIGILLMFVSIGFLGRLIRREL